MKGRPTPEQMQAFFKAHGLELVVSPTDKHYLPAKYFGPDNDIESYVIEGFMIPVLAIFDEAVNVETLQNILN